MVPDDDEHNKWIYVLKLNDILYGLKQALQNWYKKLKQAMLDIYLKPSKIDPCIFMKSGVIILVYVDDCIIISDSTMKIDYLSYTLQNGSENFVLTVKDKIHKFLGVNIEKIDKKNMNCLNRY